MAHNGHWIKVPREQLVLDAQMQAYIFILTKLSGTLTIYIPSFTTVKLEPSEYIHIYQNPSYSKIEKIRQVFNEFIDQKKRIEIINNYILENVASTSKIGRQRSWLHMKEYTQRKIQEKYLPMQILPSFILSNFNAFKVVPCFAANHLSEPTLVIFRIKIPGTISTV